jgi:hypothetical protein
MKTLSNLNFLFLFALAALMFGCSQGQKSGESTEETATDETTEAVAEETAAPNTLTAKEKEDGWMLLFDGKSTEGWRRYGAESFPSAWVIDDNALHIQGSGRGEAGAEEGGDILYDKMFGNFHLKFEWKVSEGANSGVLYLGQESPEYDFIWMTAPEYQVLDNERHPDAMLGENGNRQSASLYDIYPADPQNAKPAGEWNTGEIIVYNGTVVHKQNGVSVVEYHLWTPKWYEDVANSKFPELNENWAEVAKEGYIALQDHGDDVWFRNIKIKEL